MADIFHIWRRNSSLAHLDGYVFTTRNYRPQDYPLAGGDWVKYTHLGESEEFGEITPLLRFWKAASE